MKKLFSLSILLLVFFKLSIGQLEITSKITLKDEFSEIEVDHYGYIYVIKDDNLLKLDDTQSIIYSYSNKLFGEISQLDISNPLRPLIFYKDQGIITVLDNTLSQQKYVISLNEIGLYQSKCIANSNFDNGIWLYDIDINEIVKIDHLSNIIYRSGNLSVILNEMNSPVIKLYEKNKKLYAITTNKIFTLDQFGSLISSINTSAKNGIIVTENELWCYDGEFITTYENLDFKIDTIQKSSAYIKIMGFSEKLVGVSKNRKDLYSLELRK